MIKQRTIMAAWLAAVSLAAGAQAQKQRTVVDGDTGLGIPGVSITAKDFAVVTDSAGRFTLPGDCRTLVFSHINYASYMANINDIGDTVVLYSDSRRLDEVLVFGTPKEDPLADLNQRLRIDKTEAQLMSANPNGNLLGLLKYLVPKKWRTSKKQQRKERLKQVLDEY